MCRVVASRSGAARRGPRHGARRRGRRWGRTSWVTSMSLRVPSLDRGRSPDPRGLGERCGGRMVDGGTAGSASPTPPRTSGPRLTAVATLPLTLLDLLRPWTRMVPTGSACVTCSVRHAAANLLQRQGRPPYGSRPVWIIGVLPRCRRATRRPRPRVVRKRAPPQSECPSVTSLNLLRSRRPACDGRGAISACGRAKPSQGGCLFALAATGNPVGCCCVVDGVDRVAASFPDGVPRRDSLPLSLQMTLLR